MKIFNKPLIHVISISIIPLLFLIIGIITLSDYGINWDEPTHFNRGQGYLNYLLTGNKEENLPITNRPSFFHNHAFAVKTLITWDGGHPPTSDILAAFTNLIFYQKLAVLGDVESYHLYNVIISTVAILIVAIFAYETFGIFASIIASLSFATYPLFFAESHFNIKDPPETAFLTLAIFAFWMSAEKGSWKWLLVTSISTGLALGTKFNVIFLPLIIIPYLFIRYYALIKNKKKNFISLYKKIPRTYMLMFIIAPFVVLSIFFGTWPFLWEDTFQHLSKVIHYYKDIGTGFNYQPIEYRFIGFNFYPVYWILITTPPIVLFFSFIGIISAFIKSDKKKTHILFLIWFIVPIFRVMLPNTTIYGGVRQIMEYIPAMALLSGIGAYQNIRWLEKFFKLGLNYSPVGTVISYRNYRSLLIRSLVIIIFLPIILTLVRIHPNQNVYFNQLIGGLNGAKEKNIPSWGNSYGNAYWQALKWLNINAEKNSKFALVQGTGQNIAGLYIRPDIIFSNVAWSGINRNGEYLMELTYEGSTREYPYVWDYIEKFLNPVYEVKVEGVSIAKIWKNDLDHTKKEMKKMEIKYKNINKIIWNDGEVLIDLGDKVVLSRLNVPYNNSLDCSKEGMVYLSFDGKVWGLEPDKLSTEQVQHRFDIGLNSTNFYFPAKEARFIKIIHNKDNSCYFPDTIIDVYVFEQ